MGKRLTFRDRDDRFRRALDLIRRGKRAPEAAAAVGVSRTTVQRWLRAAGGQVSPQTTPQRGTVRIAWQTVIETDASAVAALSEAERLVWRQVSSEVGRAAVAGGFDPRAVLSLSAPELIAWRARRRAHLTDKFKRDRRVSMGKADG